MDRAYLVIVSKTMAKHHLELASPFASWALINNEAFNVIIWG